MNNPTKKILFIILCALAAAWMLWKFSEPFVLVRQLKAETEPMRAEREQLKEGNRLLERQIAELKTPEVMELEARRQGWIKPGERRLVFTEPAPVAPEVLPEALPANDNIPIFSRVRAWSRNSAARICGVQLPDQPQEPAAPAGN